METATDKVIISMGTTVMVAGLLVLLFFAGRGLWRAATFLSARGIGPDGPTSERRMALAKGWNGIGPLPVRGGVHATSLMTHPPEPPTPVAKPAHA